MYAKLATDGGRSLRVLVVDDHRDAADSLALLLRLWGYLPWVAYDAATAFQLYAITCPDVALIDLAMPGMDGTALARCIREAFPERGAKLAAVSGYADQAHRRLALASGFDRYFIKPLEVSELHAWLARIGKTLGCGAGYQSAPASPTPYRFKLFVSGNDRRTRRALATLDGICAEGLLPQPSIQIVDVREQPELAEVQKVLATPLLVKEAPSPVARIIGELIDRQAVLRGLGIAV